MAAPGTVIEVFLADDHAVLLEGLTQLLHMHEVRVVGSSSEGHAALEKIVALQPDVALLDISMPGLSGIEITERLAQAGSRVAVVILSVHDSSEFVFRALASGARGYLLKESASAEIVTAIRAVSAGRRYLSPRIATILADQAGSRGVGGKSPLESLTPREREVLQFVAEGQSSAQIGRHLNLSPKTVDTYRSRLMSKIGVHDVVSLLRFALRHGLIPL
jgi:DNA-binding NarL/FixJ family response regulator